MNLAQDQSNFITLECPSCGGSWSYQSDYLRVAKRIWINPSGRYYDLGFRCAASLPGD